MVVELSLDANATTVWLSSAWAVGDQELDESPCAQLAHDLASDVVLVGGRHPEVTRQLLQWTSVHKRERAFLRRLFGLRELAQARVAGITSARPPETPAATAGAPRRAEREPRSRVIEPRERRIERANCLNCRSPRASTKQ